MATFQNPMHMPEQEPVENRDAVFQPLDTGNLAESIAHAFLRRPIVDLPPENVPPGVGIYALYYIRERKSLSADINPQSLRGVASSPIRWKSNHQGHSHRHHSTAEEALCPRPLANSHQTSRRGGFLAFGIQMSLSTARTSMGTTRRIIAHWAFQATLERDCERIWQQSCGRRANAATAVKVGHTPSRTGLVRIAACWRHHSSESCGGSWGPH